MEETSILAMRLRWVSVTCRGSRNLLNCAASIYAPARAALDSCAPALATAPLGGAVGRLPADSWEEEGVLRMNEAGGARALTRLVQVTALRKGD
jgi:hypothetical protein